VVLRDGNQHICRGDAWVGCQVFDYLLVKGLLGLVRSPSPHEQMYHHAVSLTGLQLQAIRIDLMNDLVTVIGREVHGFDDRGVDPIDHSVDIFGRLALEDGNIHQRHDWAPFFEPNKMSVYIYPETDAKHIGRHLGKRQLFLPLLSTICNKDKQRMLVTKPSMLLYGYAGPNNIC